jgi:hypothetical protein
MADKALKPILQKKVLFYEDKITAVLVEVDGEEHVYVPIRPICDYLGLSYTGQRNRIMRDPVLSENSHRIEIERTVEQGSNQEMVCLALKFLPGWLFGVSVSRIKEDLREKIIRYQRECYDVLWEAFQERRLMPDPGIEALLASDAPAAQAYKMAAAIMKMARQQLMLEAELATHANKLDDHESRLESLEIVLGDPGHHITPEQAMQISQAVKAVAHELGKRTRRNEYGGVYGELYRRYEVNSYKHLPKAKFDEALNWLNEWLQSLISDSPF